MLSSAMRVWLVGALLCGGCQGQPDAGSVVAAVKMNLEALGVTVLGTGEAAEVRAALCGGTHGGHPWRMRVQRLKILGSIKAEGTQLEVAGTCLSHDELAERTFAGTVRATMRSHSSTIYRRLWRRSETTSMWMLAGLAVEHSQSPGPIGSASAGRVSKEAPRAACPETLEDAVRTFPQSSLAMLSCELGGPVCWYGERGCRCQQDGVSPRWKCASAGCPTPKPEVDAPCESTLSRCLEEGKRALECRVGTWRRVTLE